MCKMELVGRQRKLVFRGACLDLLSVCEATCCRNWDVTLTPEEIASGLFRLEEICRLTRAACTKEAPSCGHRKVRLPVQADGACTYLLEDGKCSIYETRPRACRDFRCDSGWYLSSVASTEGGTTKERFLAQPPEEAVFILHPLVRLCSIFRVEQDDEVVFVCQLVGGCELFCTRESGMSQQVRAQDLLSLVAMFTGDTLRSIHLRVCAELQVEMEKTRFYDLVWVLLRHHLILDSRILEGLLAGLNMSTHVQESQGRTRGRP
jgi:Fe-S-cluster containining protein